MTLLRTLSKEGREERERGRGRRKREREILKARTGTSFTWCPTLSKVEKAVIGRERREEDRKREKRRRRGRGRERERERWLIILWLRRWKMLENWCSLLLLWTQNSVKLGMNR
jgi:hypothetical protein